MIGLQNREESPVQRRQDEMAEASEDHADPVQASSAVQQQPVQLSASDASDVFGNYADGAVQQSADANVQLSELKQGGRFGDKVWSKDNKKKKEGEETSEEEEKKKEKRRGRFGEPTS